MSEKPGMMEFGTPEFNVASDVSLALQKLLTEIMHEPAYASMSPENIANVVARQLTEMSRPEQLTAFFKQRDEK